MNLWQVGQQAKYLLQQKTWSDGATVVFAPQSVLCLSSDSEIDALDANLVMPMAVVVLGSGQSDPQANDEPGYWVRDMTVALAVRNYNDRTGQAAVMGASRVGVSDSRGRGLLEIEERVLSALELLNELEGITVALKSQSATMTRKDPSDSVYAIKEYVFEVSCASQLFYPAPRRMAATVLGSGQVSLAWTLPVSRYDRYRVVMRRLSGSTAPGSITAGTGVTLSSTLATSVIDTPGAGTWSYSLFCTYDDFASTNNAAAPASDLRSSDALSVSGVVAT